MAIDAISDLKGYRDDIDEAITALREALAAPEPEPVALESVHLTRDTRGMCVVRVNGRVAIRDNGDIIDHMATLEWFAAPPAAPADDHATPSGGQEAGPQEDRIEAAYWRFDARHKGYSQWKTAPMSERDAFKAEMRNALEAEKVRAEMRLVARGWRRPDAPAAPAVPLTIDQEKALSAEAKTGPFQHTTPIFGNDMQSGETPRLSSNRHAGSTPPAAPAPAGWVMVPRGLLRRLIAEALTFDPSLQDKEAIEQAKQLAASPAAPVVREPFSRAQLHRLYVNSPELHKDTASEAAFTRIVQLTEAAHGITGGSNAT